MKGRRFERAVPWAQEGLPGAGEADGERQAPVPAGRSPDLVADLVVPAGQAAITGALVGALATYGAAALGYGGDLGTFWAGWALGVGAITWVLLLLDTRRLLWTVERLIGVDLDKDGVTGKPKERVVLVNAGSHPVGGTLQGRQAAAEREAADRVSLFEQFVAGLETKGTAARTWESLLGRDVYQEYRDALIRVGWAQWNSMDELGRPNEKRGWSLSVPGVEILRRIA